MAFNHGKTAALNMLGRGVEHDVLPYFFSDLADWASLEYVGPGSASWSCAGSLEEGNFAAFYLHEEHGHVVAALSVGRARRPGARPRASSPSDTKPDATALADEDTDLSSL